MRSKLSLKSQVEWIDKGVKTEDKSLNIFLKHGFQENGQLACMYL